MFIPLFSFIIANIALPESLFLINVLVYEKNCVTLCTGIGYMSPLVLVTESYLFLATCARNPMLLCAFIYMHKQTSKT